MIWENNKVTFDMIFAFAFFFFIIINAILLGFLVW